MTENTSFIIPHCGGRVVLCDINEYRMELYDKFKTSAIIALLIETMSRVDDPDAFRETLLNTWKDKMREDREESMADLKRRLEEMKSSEDDIPEQLSDESLNEQQVFFDSLMEEMVTDLRAMLNSPKKGGA